MTEKPNGENNEVCMSWQVHVYVHVMLSARFLSISFSHFEGSHNNNQQLSEPNNKQKKLLCSLLSFFAHPPDRTLKGGRRKEGNKGKGG